ncbi:unnamed protein product [Vitrella brassicaformis CCMP3155]|uniref:Sugar phosphate transporter domain-containing protein n=2 Tax=Vitrella brassicaformis TaxID=1169539 RepID=A0A0G4F656_VITBC|nr:unnamed protein product [Vitrella brassicaformis CCMP3155]|eukprot:CEM07874.1 unnamed protein product [Vitrella brassicaformis CCMP3155]
MAASGGMGLLPPDIERLVAVITFYMVVSLSIVFLNFSIFTKVVTLPVFVSWFQMVVSFALTNVFGRLGQRYESLSFWPPYSFNWNTATTILPLTLSYVGMITMNNVCLKYVAVSTYQVARSSTILFNLLLSRYLLHAEISVQAVYACVVVCLGIVAGALDPKSLTLLGLLTGTVGSLFWALYSVNVKKYLALVDGNQFVLLNYNLTWSCILFLPLIFLFQEHTGVVDIPTDPTDESFYQVWGAMVLSGVFGFMMNIAVFLVIKATSPLTFNIIGTVKATIQSLGGFLIFGDETNLQNITGIALCLVGSFWYGKAKQAQAQQERERLPTTTTDAEKKGLVMGEKDGKEMVIGRPSDEDNSSSVSTHVSSSDSPHKHQHHYTTVVGGTSKKTVGSVNPMSDSDEDEAADGDLDDPDVRKMKSLLGGRA